MDRVGVEGMAFTYREGVKANRLEYSMIGNVDPITDRRLESGDDVRRLV